MSQALSGISFI